MDAHLWNSLDDLAHLPRWVEWRNETQNDRLSKTPYNPAGGPAKTDDPRTWGIRRQAEMAAARAANTLGGGIGIVLGELASGRALGGVDLDSCRNDAGEFQPWALAIMRELGTYCETSPSGTGAKAFFYYDVHALPELRAAMGTAWGKSWKRAGTAHPPAIELFLGHKYFATTFNKVPFCPSELRQVDTASLLHLIQRTGPAFAGKAIAHPKTGFGDDRICDDLSPRIAALAAHDSALRRLLAGDFSNLNDKSRSGVAFAFAGALRRGGFNEEETKQAVCASSVTAEWAREQDDRALNRLWQNQVDVGASAEWGTPDMSVLQLARRQAPPLPLDVFGPRWAAWITEAAHASAAPVDYVALPLLAVASALIGHARWVQGWPGWMEPPHLWLGVVGDSGSSKSPGSDCLLRDVVPELERRMRADFPDRVAEWRVAAELHKAKTQAWERDVITAHKNEDSPPPAPGEIPPEPQAPRLTQSDVTIERLATLLASAAPKGLLVARDELAGFLCGMTAYNEAGRAFWLEGFGGRAYKVERQKSPEPIIIPRFAVAVIGGTQPERLAAMFREADDGLLARFAWAWPEPLKFRMSTVAPNKQFATDALDRLRSLEMLAAPPPAPPEPVYVPLVDDARPVLEMFGQDMQSAQQSAGGLMRSAYGKARGLALRLALNLEHLRWAALDGHAAPPSTISTETMISACELVADYFIPMAERVYGDAALPAVERNATALARWIIKERRTELNVRDLQRKVRLPGLRDAASIHAACALLVEADWLRSPAPGGFQSKAKGTFPVNPAIWSTPHDDTMG